MTFVAPSSRAVVKERIDGTLRDRARNPPLEQIWQRVDGTPVEVEVSGSRVQWQGRPAVKVIARDITERRKTDAELRMLRHAIDSAVDAIYWMRPDGGFDYVNAAACRMLGYSHGELMQMNVWDLNPGLARRDWPQRFAEIKKGLGQSSTFESVRRGNDDVFELEHRAKDGRLIPVEVTVNYVQFGDQESAFALVRDGRERKQTEMALNTTQFAVDSASDAVYLLRSDGGIVYANTSASTMLGFSRDQLVTMSVFDINPDQTQKTFTKAFGRYKRGQGPPFVEQRHTCKDGNVVSVEVSSSYFKFGVHEGLFAFARDISERKIAEASIRESEARYRSVVELSPDPILVNCGGKIAFVNTAGLKVLGAANAGDIVGKDALAFLHPESRDLIAGRIGEALRTKTGAQPAEIKWVRPDGSVVEVESSTSFITWEGKPALQVVVRDITERKRTEQALQLTQFAIDQASDAVYLVRPDGRFDYANMAASKMLGYSQEELRSMSVQDINPDISASGWKKRFALIKQGSSDTLFTGQHHQTKDGRLVPVEISGNYYRVGEVTGMVTFVRDVSARDAAETAMRESEARYRSVVEQSPDAIFINCEGKLVFVNTAGTKLFKAKSNDELIGRDAMTTIHPDTRERARKRIQQVIKKKQTVPPAEQRWIAVDGSALEVESTASYVVWGGKPALQVVARDISERKQAERVLKLTQFAIDRGFDAFIRVDSDGHCVDLNEASCRLLGYSRDELLDMALSDFVVGTSKSSWRQAFDELRKVGT